MNWQGALTQSALCATTHAQPVKAGEKRWKAVWGSYTEPVALMSNAAVKKDDPQWAFYSVTEWGFGVFMFGIKG